jgi:SAM-dependent methyltransferase
VRPGDRVLVVGEGVGPAGWAEHLERAVGADGLVDVVEIIHEGRRHVLEGIRGRNGVRGCWRWEYTQHLPDGYYDVVAVLQSTQHCDDWGETGPELLRVMQPGRRIVFAEISFGGPTFASRINADLHVRQWHDKLGLPEGIPFYSADDLMELFGRAHLEEPQVFEWKGIEMLWGRRPIR